ncbi:hypothetical protein TNCV_474771 [Trichonephila clavipes]|nr:hypothetical protein TNCV_474771 [Trichonephila clavipes]
MDVCSPIFKLSDPFSNFAVTHCFCATNFCTLAKNVCSRHVYRSHKRRIKERFSHFPGDSTTLNILKTHRESYTAAAESEMARVFSQMMLFSVAETQLRRSHELGN